VNGSSIVDLLNPNLTQTNAMRIESEKMLAQVEESFRKARPAKISLKPTGPMMGIPHHLATA
jgi:hypothetical protein